jgi:sucrose-6-phosphate hydrolase SacC (GH32 family)
MLAGKWYEIGQSKDFRTCECPSVYPLPAATPGTEAAFDAARRAGALPTTVHKTSCGGDWWQMGTYVGGAPKKLGSFNATPGWEDLWDQKRIDEGQFYASKDSEYPTLGGGKRRINWGWATVPPQSTQTLPREITFNAEARTLQQYPIEELTKLREPAAFDKKGLHLSGSLDLGLAKGVTKQSELVASFTLPDGAASFGVSVGDANPPTTHVEKYMNDTDVPGADYNITHYPANTDPKTCESACAADDKCKAWTFVIRGQPAGSGDCCLKNSVPCPVKGRTSCTSGAKKATDLSCGGTAMKCSVDYKPPSAHGEAVANEVAVACGGAKDTLRLLPSEKTVELRLFSDWTMVEAYFQRGRVAITQSVALGDDSALELSATAPMEADAAVYPMKSIWVTPDDVLKAPRVYH